MWIKLHQILLCKNIIIYTLCYFLYQISYTHQNASYAYNPFFFSLSLTSFLLFSPPSLNFYYHVFHQQSKVVQKLLQVNNKKMQAKLVLLQSHTNQSLIHLIMVLLLDKFKKQIQKRLTLRRMHPFQQLESITPTY